jgi:hypothetical protein
LIAQRAGVIEAGISHTFYVIGCCYIPKSPFHTIAIPVDDKNERK